MSARLDRREFITLPGAAAVLGCTILAGAQTAVAQSFPARPLTLVVPFAAGGPSDVAGRIVAQGLSEKLGQQVIVENPAGAGGTLGSLRVQKRHLTAINSSSATAALMLGVKRSTKNPPTIRSPISRRSGLSSRPRVRSLPQRIFQQIRSPNSLHM
jgi:tripartite-type tricarboxylate transporter receptor subunit TctC